MDPLLPLFGHLEAFVRDSLCPLLIDDVILVGLGSLHEFVALKKVLDDFCFASGIQVNDL
jgi:hypothetical protein